MKIDKQRLNLVIPVEDEFGKPKAFVHSTPISREMFEVHFEPLSKTYGDMYGTNDLRQLAGTARTAYLRLRKAAKELNAWDGPAGVEQGLLADIERLTSVMAPTDKGDWQSVPYKIAVQKGILDSDDDFEVKNALVFFTCASWLLPKAMRNDMVSGAVRMWGAETSSLSPSDYVASWKKSKSKETSGETEAESSPPSSTG